MGNTGEPYWAISSSIWANDLGSTMMEENVVASAGVTNSMNQDEMIKLIRDIGRTQQREIPHIIFGEILDVEETI